VAVLQAVRTGDDEARRRQEHILSAAERCIARSGFHRTTMQDVAVEAGMSPGNLYRYFPSKDALVAGLAERDRAEMGRDLAQLAAAEDFLGTLQRLITKHFEEEPRERAVICLEIWAEGTRNPAFAAIHAEFDREAMARITDLFAQAKRKGAVAAEVDPAAVASLVCTLVNGLFVRRALMSAFDAATEVGTMMAVVEAACSGRIRLPEPSAVGAMEFVA
jgi:TetR/AcrR family transcriptional regulator, repressor for uid operon